MEVDLASAGSKIEKGNYMKNTMSTSTFMSKTNRLLKFLKTGGNITQAQAVSRFDISNLSATASTLRFQGYAVYCNEKVLNNGNVITTYRLGTPTREVVAAGYRALAAA